MMLAICSSSFRSTTYGSSKFDCFERRSDRSRTRLVGQNLRHTRSRYFETSRPNITKQKSSSRNGIRSASEPIFSMAKYDTVRVLPTGKNPKGLCMLSNLDQYVQFPVELLFSFGTNSSLVDVNIGGILKQSLSKVLEVYYPLAGRLKVGPGPDGKMVVDCDVVEGGIPFAEGFLDEDMAAAVGDITMIDQKLVRKLVYPNRKPYETMLDAPALEIQVTRFRCGGMILGVRLNHVFMDGRGLGDFMKSWSEIARGLPLSIKPYLDRSIFSPRKPLKIQFPHHEYSKLEKPLAPIHNQIIVTKSFCFTPTMLSRLRELATQENENETVFQGPTTFELISALVWVCWTKAKKVGPEETTQILTAVDGRLKLHPRVPKGYFGNVLVFSCARSRAREITSLPLSYTVGIVHDAIKAVTEDYVKSTIDFHEMTSKPLETDNTICITTWTRLPFYEVDFGWGVPSQVAPGAVYKNLVNCFSHGKDSKNLVISLNLPIDAMETFQELITSQLEI